MKKENGLYNFLNETPGDMSLWGGYREYMWYDGPIIFSIGTATRRYLFQAVAEDERSKAVDRTAYLVIPMTAKRESDVANNKLSLRQAALHSGGKVFKTYDFGRSFEVVEILGNNELCEKGVRVSFNHPAWHRKFKKWAAKRKLRDARGRRSVSGI